VNKTRQFGTLAAAVLVLGAIVIAQDSAARQGGAAAKSNEQKVVMAGCLRWTEPTPTGTASGVVEYMLTNAVMVNSSSIAAKAGTAATGTSGNAGASARTGVAEKGMTYALAVEKPAELKKYENQRIEVTGRMPSSSPAPGAAQPVDSKPHSATNAPRLRVDAVKPVGGSCDAK
jgi:hypothetical protein